MRISFSSHIGHQTIRRLSHNTILQFEQEAIYKLGNNRPEETQCSSDKSSEANIYGVNTGNKVNKLFDWLLLWYEYLSPKLMQEFSLQCLTLMVLTGRKFKTITVFGGGILGK